MLSPAFLRGPPLNMFDLRRNDESREDLMKKYDKELAALRQDSLHAYCSCQVHLEVILQLSPPFCVFMFFSCWPAIMAASNRETGGPNKVERKTHKGFIKEAGNATAQWQKAIHL